MNPERNSPCPCGSGRKYKKCCSPKYDQPIATPASPADPEINIHSWHSQQWDLKDLERMSEQAILDKLGELGIPMTKARFLQDIANQYDLEPVVNLWETRYSVQYEIRDRDADFPLFAVWELWRRWKPDQYGIHMLDDIIIEIVQAKSRKDIFPKFVRFWKLTKQHLILPLRIRSLEELNNRFEWYYDMESVFFDLEVEFVNTFLHDKVHRKERFVELISLLEDILHTLPESHLSTIQQLRCSLAQAYFYLEDIEKGEKLFAQLIEDYPDWAGGYAGLGDMYTEAVFLPDLYDEEKALEIYQLGLRKCTDIEELEMRISDMEEVQSS